MTWNHLRITFKKTKEPILLWSTINIYNKSVVCINEGWCSDSQWLKTCNPCVELNSLINGVSREFRTGRGWSVSRGDSYIGGATRWQLVDTLHNLCNFSKALLVINEHLISFYSQLFSHLILFNVILKNFNPKVLIHFPTGRRKEGMSSRFCFYLLYNVSLNIPGLLFLNRIMYILLR